MRAGAFLGASLIVAPHDGRNIVQISSREQLVFPAQAILVFASRPISVTHRRSPHVRDPSFETAAKTGHLLLLLPLVQLQTLPIKNSTRVALGITQEV